MTCHAQYFDGLSSASVAVVISFEQGRLHISGADFSKHWAFSSFTVSEKLGNTPRIIRHSADGFCEVSDLLALESLLCAHGQRESVLDNLHHGWSGALLAVFFILTFFGASYQYGLPVLSKALAMSLPQASVNMLDADTLDSLDKTFLAPSDLSPVRKKIISDGFSRLVLSQAQTHYHIVFRKSPVLGANAFALPSGNIIVLDELIALSSNDEEIYGVLAHELGHVKNRHGLRMLLQSSIVGLVTTWWLGDASSILAALPATLIGAKYSRDMEREADAYGLAILRQNHISSCQLGHLLKKLAAHGEDKKLKKNEKQHSMPSQAADYLSGHPATLDRIKALCADEGVS